ncbi:Solute carrier family 22 member 16 [Trichinella sp. T8]|nr:Solute carrier family 22 member 16 [Trichinella sp. T8]
MTFYQCMVIGYRFLKPLIYDFGVEFVKKKQLFVAVKIMEKSAKVGYLTFDEQLERIGSLGWYQVVVLILTQINYVCVTGSMLCTMFDTLAPKLIACVDPVNVTDPCLCINGTYDVQFESLLFHLTHGCHDNYMPTLWSTAVMAGGVFGSVVFGYSADRFGRKLSLLIALSGCIICNLLLTFASVHVGIVFALLSVTGFFGGGYLVISVVLPVELTTTRWRLLLTCLHGWPFGIMTMALTAYLTRRWDYFHLALAVQGLPLVVAMLFVDESPRWLILQKKYNQARQAMIRIAKFNRKPKLDFHFETELSSSTKCQVEKHPPRRYTYVHLIRDKTVFLPLLVLSYSWFSGGIITFGTYFDMSNLAGNIFLKTFITGSLKVGTGLIPLIFSRFVGRKPILIGAIAIACSTAWGSLVLYLVDLADYMPWLAIVGISAIDPMWKVNHVMSVELFPTVIRSMSRAVCNVCSRLASLIAPQIAFLSSIYSPLPFVVYGTLSLLHILIAAIWLPETNNRPLPEELSAENNTQSIQSTHQTLTVDGQTGDNVAGGIVANYRNQRAQKTTVVVVDTDVGTADQDVIVGRRCDRRGAGRTGRFEGKTEQRLVVVVENEHFHGAGVEHDHASTTVDGQIDRLDEFGKRERLDRLSVQRPLGDQFRTPVQRQQSVGTDVQTDRAVTVQSRTAELIFALTVAGDRFDPVVTSVQDEQTTVGTATHAHRLKQRRRRFQFVPTVVLPQWIVVQSDFQTQGTVFDRSTENGHRQTVPSGNGGRVNQFVSTVVSVDHFHRTMPAGRLDTDGIVGSRFQTSQPSLDRIATGDAISTLVIDRRQTNAAPKIDHLDHTHLGLTKQRERFADRYSTVRTDQTFDSRPTFQTSIFRIIPDETIFSGFDQRQRRIELLVQRANTSGNIAYVQFGLKFDALTFNFNFFTFNNTQLILNE